jgi:radical SAM superfamily enzyme YgiQ (UPF0313 family)
MKILFINPRYNEKEYRYKVNKISPPLGMSHIASVLLGEGHSVSFLDMEAVQMEWRELPQRLIIESADLIGIHGTTPISHCISRCAQIVRDTCPKATIVVGGAHATLLPESLLADIPQVDYLLRGEAEFTLKNLVNRIGTSGSATDLDEIPGLGFRANGRPSISDQIPTIKNLDTLPLPAYDLLPLDAYFEGNRLAESEGDRRIFSIMSSRGCPYSCIFCSAPVLYGHRYRSRSAENVVNEISVLVNDYKIKHIVFYDASFAADRKRVEDICRTILDRALDVTWRARVRADTITESLLRLMKKAGCTTVAIGVEAGTQRLLDILKKRCTLKDIENAFQAAKSAGMWTVGYFMLGIPGETREDSHQTIEFAKKLDPDWALFTHATPLPGTELFKMSRDNVLTSDWRQYKFSANSPVLPYDGMGQDELRKMMDYAFRSFYVRKKWLVNRLKKVQSPDQMEMIVDSFMHYIERSPSV